MCHVKPDLDIFWKVNSTNRGLNFKDTLFTLYLRHLGFHAKLVFFLNIFSGNLYIDALIIELFQIWLPINKNLGEGTI